MAKMMNPEVEVVRFENEDVISASVRVYRSGSSEWFVSTPNKGWTGYSDAASAAQAIVNYYSPNGQTSQDNMGRLVAVINDMYEDTSGGNNAPEAYYDSTNNDGYQYGIQSY